MFPYQFTRCTTGPKPAPVCPANNTCTHGPADNGPCEFSRLAGQQGGTVTVSYIGPLQPPVSLSSPPPGSTPPPGLATATSDIHTTAGISPPPGFTVPMPGQPGTPPYRTHPLEGTQRNSPLIVPLVKPRTRKFIVRTDGHKLLSEDLLNLERCQTSIPNQISPQQMTDLNIGSLSQCVFKESQVKHH